MKNILRSSKFCWGPPKFDYLVDRMFGPIKSLFWKLLRTTSVCSLENFCLWKEDPVPTIFVSLMIKIVIGRLQLKSMKNFMKVPNLNGICVTYIESEMSCIKIFFFTAWATFLWCSLGSNQCNQWVATQWPYKHAPQLKGTVAVEGNFKPFGSLAMSSLRWFFLYDIFIAWTKHIFRTLSEQLLLLVCWFYWCFKFFKAFQVLGCPSDFMNVLPVIV